MPQTEELDLIKDFENVGREGFMRDTQLWFPHESLEGGNATVGYGHKLTDDEIKRGTVKIDNDFVSISQGFTEDHVNRLAQQDTSIARTFIRSTFPNLSPNEQIAATSLVFNTGEATFSKLKNGRRTKASKCLASYNADRSDTTARDCFVKEAFSKERGFVSGGGKKLAGLINRRAAEGELFLRDSAQGATS